jgi:hypothetical protein
MTQVTATVEYTVLYSICVLAHVMATARVKV